MRSSSEATFSSAEQRDRGLCFDFRLFLKRLVAALRSISEVKAQARYSALRTSESALMRAVMVRQLVMVKMA